MALFPSSRPGIRVRVLPRFPARVVAGAGVSAPIANGTMTLGLDYPSLVDSAGIPDPSRRTFAAYNRDTLSYEEVRGDQLPVPTETATRTPRGDATYAILNTDRYVALTATLTAPRVWTLPTASSVPAGRLLVIQDEVGGISSANTLTISKAGADTINGAASYVLAAPRNGVEFRSDGTSQWTMRLIQTAQIIDKAVTAAKMEDLAQATILGRAAGAGTGSRQALTPAQAKAILALVAADVSGAAASGANSDITSLSGLTTPLSVAQGGTGEAGTAWTSYTPTVTPNAGTFTTVTASGRYKKIGRLVAVQVSITITNAGTGVGINASIPVQSSASALSSVLAGREDALTGKMLQGTIAANATTCSIVNYDNSNPVGTGNKLVLTGVYESAT